MGGESQIKLGGTPTFPKLSAAPVGQKIQGIYKDRLRQFSDPGQYESQNLQA